IRVDAGVREGDVVSQFYDPMIAKVIAHADTREGAAAALAGGLRHARIAGVHTNNAFLIRALSHPDFVAGRFDTGFIAAHQGDLIPAADIPHFALEAAADFVMREHWRETSDPWDHNDGFRLAGGAAQEMALIVHEKRVAIALPPPPPGADVEAMRLANGDIAIMHGGETFVVTPFDPFAAAESAGQSADRIVTPMPGKIVQVLVKTGEAVKRGQPLAVLEAMKMEHTLSAPADAQVESVDVAQGDQVSEGAVILRFAKPQSEAA
ncbi:MAG TPA: biotin/lipoyl-containing protein, partial [Rhizomicrobium sp.]|nr:biotin/lipoyl-containing protein [Rhizomicrobium sp.]